VDDAIEAFERSLQAQPTNAKAYYSLGILFDKKNMPDRAMRMYRRARDLQSPGRSS
jgi:Flp pilus assembly protein TadD